MTASELIARVSELLKGENLPLDTEVRIMPNEFESSIYLITVNEAGAYTEETYKDKAGRNRRRYNPKPTIEIEGW